MHVHSGLGRDPHYDLTLTETTQPIGGYVVSHQADRVLLENATWAASHISVLGKVTLRGECDGHRILLTVQILRLSIEYQRHWLLLSRHHASSIVSA